VGAALLLAVSGCSSAPSSARAVGARVSVTEKDFQISGPSSRLSSGDVVLSVTNDGPDDHELIVVRRDGSTLPVRADGVTIDEEALEQVTLGALEPGAPGSVRELELHLEPGRYALFCNMAGHYFGGMHAELVVT
jgi:uncharacterized cupredoxin-like copper-binding protein